MVEALPAQAHDERLFADNWLHVPDLLTTPAAPFTGFSSFYADHSSKGLVLAIHFLVSGAREKLAELGLDIAEAHSLSQGDALQEMESSTDDSDKRSGALDYFSLIDSLERAYRAETGEHALEHLSQGIATFVAWSKPRGKLRERNKDNAGASRSAATAAATSKAVKAYLASIGYGEGKEKLEYYLLEAANHFDVSRSHIYRQLRADPKEPPKP